MTDRRSFIALAKAALLAGCTGGGQRRRPAPAANKKSQLVARLHFTAGLTLLDLSFKDPNGKSFPAPSYGGAKAANWKTINYAAGFRSGYVTYNLSQSIPAGAYSLTFNAQLADGITNVTYTATFTL